MGWFCDVALPVPLDRVFTYAVEVVPAVGVRVLVPFRRHRLMGVVVRVHQDAPSMEVKEVQQVMDERPLLPNELMELAEWIAAYYMAPLGEVLRGMMPLGAEVKRRFLYRIADGGRRVLYEGAVNGSSRRSRLPAEEQNREYAVLNYLESGEAAKMGGLRSATGAPKQLLEGMVKKRWLVREVVAEERDARRMEPWAVQIADVRSPKLNENQRAMLVELTGSGGRIPVRALRALGLPASTLGTLMRRGLVRIEEVEEKFHFGGAGTGSKKSAHEHALNEGQKEAVETIAGSLERGEFRVHLLYGVTGSGKTAVYVAAMHRTLATGQSALMLVPEIGLTSGIAGQMYAAFGPTVAVLHSGLTPDQRADQWHRIQRGDARVVVGTRSSVFAPVSRLGLVIVDEEHDSSYKQEETPRYHGRDVAVMRAKCNGAVVVLGSATPSLESWVNAKKGRYELIEMRERVMGRPLPAVELVNMRDEFQAVGLEKKGQEALFSRGLVRETQETLDRGEQVIILLNRRGYSFVATCRSCGERMECENCAISVTYHKAAEGELARGARMECHYCGSRQEVPKRCPKCDSEHLYFLGAGSQQGEERLQEIFPRARIARMDRDTVSGRNGLERMLARLHAGEINLLVGTQMIAKGHDIHGVTLVGVVGADMALGMPDFRAAERVFQLLTQVAGRAGRGERPGKVIVQTYYPEHYAIKFAAAHDYLGFVAKEMQFRQWMHYPPVSVLANVVISSYKLDEAAAWAGTLGQWFRRTSAAGVRVLGPAAAPIAKLKRVHRFHLVLKAEGRSVLGETLRRMLAFAEAEGIPRRGLSVDVDPVSLM